MKLTEREICDRVEEKEDSLSAYRKKAERWDKMWQLQVFERDERQAAAEGQEQIVLPTPKNTVNLALRLVSDKPKIQVPPREHTADSNALKEKRESWLSAMWQQQRNQHGTNPVNNAAWQSFVLGKHLFEVKWVKDKIPKKLKKRIFPISIRNLSPLNAAVQRGPLFTEYAYHKYDAELWQVAQRYPDVLNKKFMKGRKKDSQAWRTEEVCITDFWYTDEEGGIWNAVLADEEFVIPPRQTDYPDIPIIEGVGETSMSFDESMRAVGLLDSIDGLWQSQCKALSQQATGMLWYFWPFIYATNDQGQIISDLRIRPGGMEQFPPGTKINVVSIEPNMALSSNVMATLEQAMQQSTFPAVMYGESPGSMQAGYGVSMLKSAAEGRVGTPIANLENSMGNVNSLCMGLVEEMAGKEGVDIWGTSQKNNKVFRLCLYPEDMEDGYYDNQVILNPVLPEDDMARLSLGMQLVNAGILSARTFRDNWMGIELPDDEENQIHMEQAMKSPELQPKTFIAAIMAYYPDNYREILAGTPLEQMLQQIENPQPPQLPGPPPGMDPSMMDGPPMGMPPGMDPSMMGGGPPPMDPGMMGLPPGMDPSMMGPPPGMDPGMQIQPDAMPMPQGGGIPPQMQGQISPSDLNMLAQQNPELFQQLMGNPMTEQEQLDRLAGPFLPPGA